MIDLHIIEMIFSKIILLIDLPQCAIGSIRFENETRFDVDGVRENMKPATVFIARGQIIGHRRRAEDISVAVALPKTSGVRGRLVVPARRRFVGVGKLLALAPVQEHSAQSGR